MYTKILIPLDGSKTAEKVLPYARFLAGNLKLPVELWGSLILSKWQPISPPIEPVTSIP